MAMRLLAADIHLSGAHPRRCRDFLSALSAAAADEIYLLGDLFDAWPGDDEDGAWAAEIKAALAEKTRGGTAIFVMRGNRDFLLGRRFCENTGCRLLADMHSLEEGGRRCLLAHGDLLSGEDGYLFWRGIAHSRWFALLATMLPLGWRRKAATMLRGQSQKHRRRAEIKLSAAEAALKEHRCEILIHGHTHAPGESRWQSPTQQTLRLHCLPDWESESPQFLSLTQIIAGGD